MNIQTIGNHVNPRDMPTKSIFRPKTHFMNKFLELDFWLGYLFAAVAWIGSFVYPVAPFLLFTVFLILADLVTGTKAARARKETITSGGYRRTVEKLVVYFLAILAAEGMTFVFLPSVPLAYIASFTIALAEFKSVLENVETVTGVGIVDAIKSRLKPPDKK